MFFRFLFVCFALSSLAFSNTLEFGNFFQINSKHGGSYNKALDLRVASNEKGEAIAVWYSQVSGGELPEGNIYYSMRDEDGNWSPEKQLNSSSGSTANISSLPRASINNNGIAAVVWIANDGLVIQAYASIIHPKSGPTKETLISGSKAITEPNLDMTVAINNEGTAIAVFIDSEKGVYVSETTNFKWPANPTLLSNQFSNAETVQFANLALNQKIGVLVLHTYTDTGEKVTLRLYSLFRKDNGSWTDASLIRQLSGGTGNSYLSLSNTALNDNDNALFSFVYFLNTSQYIYTVENNNFTWKTPVLLDFTHNSNITIVPDSVALNNKDRAIVSWFTIKQANKRFSDANIFVSLKTGSTKWSQPTNVSASNKESLDHSINSEVSLNNEESAFIYWLVYKEQPPLVDKTPLNIFYSVKSNDNSWQVARPLGPSSANSTSVSFLDVEDIYSGKRSFLTDDGQAFIGWIRGTKSDNPGNVFGSEGVFQAQSESSWLYELSDKASTLKIQKP